MKLQSLRYVIEACRHGNHISKPAAALNAEFVKAALKGPAER